MAKTEKTTDMSNNNNGEKLKALKLTMDKIEKDYGKGSVMMMNEKGINEMEVISTGLRQTPEQIVAAALQEDADAIGLSILSGAHMHICPRVMELLEDRGLDDVLVVVGGIIPDVDIPKLQEIGVKGIFLPGTPMQDIINFITENVRPRVEQI